MNYELSRAQKIFASSVQSLSQEPFIFMAHYKVKSLLLFMMGDKAELQHVVRLTEELLSHSFSPGVSGQAGWVFLHQALTSMEDKYHWLRKALTAFQKDLGCLEEAKLGLNITKWIWIAWANAESRQDSASTTSHTDTAVQNFYKKRAVAQLCN